MSRSKCEDINTLQDTERDKWRRRDKNGKNGSGNIGENKYQEKKVEKMASNKNNTSLEGRSG